MHAEPAEPWNMARSAACSRPVGTLGLYTLDTGQDHTLYLDGLHGADHQDGLHHPGPQATQQAFGAVQAAGGVPCVVTQELKHPKPEGQDQMLSKEGRGGVLVSDTPWETRTRLKRNAMWICGSDFVCLRKIT